jgi:GT2 family glycosyltransferase
MSGDMERFEPRESRGRLAYEHFHRYAICRSYIRDLDVLDIACGAGYGSALLAEAAGSVSAIDLNPETIERARSRYMRPNLTFAVADCFQLPFDDASFDVIVANEMIEHVADHDGLISEGKRLLRPGGIMLISTPNRPVYNRFKQPNPFHVSEMDEAEFRELLDRHFKQHRLLGCRMALNSLSYPIDVAGRNDMPMATVFLGSDETSGNVSIGTGDVSLDDPEYFIAVCGDGELPSADSDVSIYISAHDDLWLEHERILAWASQLHKEDEELRAEVAEARTALSRHQDDLATLEICLRREHADALGRLRRDTHVELATHREHAQIIRRLVTRMSGVELDEDGNASVEGLFAVNQRMAALEAQAAQLPLLTGQMEEFRTTAERQAVEARQIIERLEIQLRDRTFQIDGLLAQRQAELDRADKLQAELDDIAAQYRFAKVALNEQTTRADEASQATERVKLELEGATNQHRQSEAGLQDELAQLEQALRRAREETVQVQELREREMTQLESEWSRAMQELRDFQIELTSAEEGIAEFSEERARAERALAAERSKTQMLEQQLAASTETLEGQRQEIRNARTALKIAASCRKRAAGAEVERDEALLARNSVEYQRDLAVETAGALKKVLKRQTERMAFARAHSHVIAELDTATDAVRQNLARAPAGWGSGMLSPFRTWTKGLRSAPASFMASWLAEQRPRLRGTINWRRYRTDRALFDLDPHPLFSTSYYLAQIPSLGAQQNPLLHYLTTGWRMGLSPHPYFANDWYLSQNPDVLAAGINPLEHYLTHGWLEGRRANPVFDVQDYAARYPDVVREGLDPLLHYLMYGAKEGRDVSSALVDPQGARHWPAAARAQGPVHFLLTERAIALPEADLDPLAVDPLAERGEAWPPRQLDDYWLPQAMRDYLVDAHGEGQVDLYWYLFSVMNCYGAGERDFGASAECATLLERARLLANQPRRQSVEGIEPDASIVIPVYNNLVDTMICLVSLLELRDLATFEIIIADDCSTDATAKLVSTIGGCVRHLRREANAGFLGNCNAAAREAKGRYLILLNNDTIVLPGWLDGLLAPFERSEGIGLVGSKLLNGDGTLQEAGGIFWRDGSAWNFGRGQDPRDPGFNYLKDIDYCSGASIAAPRTLWDQLGGFDPHYLPAYCEDSDLAFRIRTEGLRTVYNPVSEVIHHEGRSHGRDLSTGIKAYQRTNQEKLLARWQSVLEDEHFENGRDVLRARDRSGKKPHILVIDHYVPQWNQDAGSRTVYEFLLTLLDLGYAVTFWPDNLYRDPQYTPQLQALGIEVMYGSTYVGHFDDFIAARGALYDAVLLSRPHIAKDYIEALRRHSQARLLYYGHDLHFERLRSGHGVAEATPETIAAMQALEVRVCSDCDVIFYPSQAEIDVISPLIAPTTRASAIPAYAFPSELLAEARDRQRAGNMLLFVGGFGHHPNVDGIKWFCEEIAPILRMDNVPFRLKIVGSRAGADILALQSNDVDVVGFVSDEELERLYAEAALVIAPLRYGAGVKGKVIEAMANGAPLVSTSVGAQGIPAPEGLMAIADDSAAFADAVEAALADRAAAQTRAMRAIDFVASAYSRAAIGAIFHAALDRVDEPS